MVTGDRSYLTTAHEYLGPTDRDGRKRSSRSPDSQRQAESRARVAAGPLKENRYITRAGALDVRAVDPSRLRVSYRVVGNSAVTISRANKFPSFANCT